MCVMIELIFVLIMVTRLHEFVKTHKTIQQNFSYFMQIIFPSKRKLLKKTARISKEVFTKERKLRLLEICKEKNNIVNISKYLALKFSLGRINIICLQIYKYLLLLKIYTNEFQYNYFVEELVSHGTITRSTIGDSSVHFL